MGTVIYGIIDPRSNMLIYVGKSISFAERKYVHKSDARANSRTRCARTIRGILAAGLEPDFFLIEEVGDGDWIEAEQFWIAYFKSIGCKLANHTAGGEGLSGWKHRPESIEKTRLAHLGSKRSDELKAKIKASWTEERKAKHVAFCKVRGMPDHQREFISRLHKGKKLPEWHKAKISDFFRGRKQTEEQKINSGLGVKASWTDDRRRAQAEILRARRATQTHCKNGHPLTGENLRLKQGRRVCRACANAWARDNSNAKRRASGVAERGPRVMRNLAVQ